MNILVLTPDRVGSTLLQRLITAYAVLNQSHSPLTINLHELTNGIVQYHNDTFNQQVLGKRADAWGYHQSLETITQQLQSADHGMVARLAHYHIKRRGDALGPQLSFYKWLNENFYIVATRRQNLFEHAISWAIVGESKNLNVFSHQQKYEAFREINQQGLNIQPDVIDKYLKQYQEYLDWVDRHFEVNAWYEYERDMPRIEQFILGLGPFKNTFKITWQDRWDISFNDWNRMHYLLSLVPFDQVFSSEENQFMTLNIEKYTQVRIWLQDLQDAGVIVNGIPIKLHTLQEKAAVVKNIDQCLLGYNHWVGEHQPQWAIPYHPETLQQTALLEHTAWRGPESAALTHNTLNTKLLRNSDLKDL
jgi:hypothetical protein